METINRKHQEITQNRRVTLAAYMVIYPKWIYFSAGACLDFGIFAGLHLHFINDEDRWYFYCNTEKDGFAITARSGKNSVIICDTSLSVLIRKRTLVSCQTKFLIQLLPSKLNGNQLAEICFNKPIVEEPNLSDE